MILTKQQYTALHRIAARGSHPFIQVEDGALIVTDSITFLKLDPDEPHAYGSFVIPFERIENAIDKAKDYSLVIFPDTQDAFISLGHHVNRKIDVFEDTRKISKAAIESIIDMRYRTLGNVFVNPDYMKNLMMFAKAFKCPWVELVPFSTQVSGTMHGNDWAIFYALMGVKK